MEASEFLLARPHLPRPPLVFDAGARELGFAGRARNARGVDGLLTTPQALDRSRAVRRHALGFDPDVVDLDVKLREGLAHPVAGDAGVFEGVPQCRGRIQRREDFAP